MSSYYPVSVTHVGLTVTDVRCNQVVHRGFQLPSHHRAAAYQERRFAHRQRLQGIFGEKYQDGYVSHLATANGIGIELFQFVVPPSEREEDNFEYWKTGVFHFCLVDPDIEGLAKRIAEMGGKQRSKVWTLFLKGSLSRRSIARIPGAT